VEEPPFFERGDCVRFCPPTGKQITHALTLIVLARRPVLLNSSQLGRRGQPPEERPPSPESLILERGG